MNILEYHTKEPLDQSLACGSSSRLAKYENIVKESDIRSFSDVYLRYFHSSDKSQIFWDNIETFLESELCGYLQYKHYVIFDENKSEKRVWHFLLSIRGIGRKALYFSRFCQALACAVDKSRRNESKKGDLRLKARQRLARRTGKKDEAMGKTTNVNRWGNSLAVRIPSDVVKEMNISEKTVFEISIKNDTLQLRPENEKRRKVPRYRLSDLLENLTPEAVRLDFDWGEDVGEEIVK